MAAKAFAASHAYFVIQRYDESMILIYSARTDPFPFVAQDEIDCIFLDLENYKTD